MSTYSLLIIEWEANSMKFDNFVTSYIFISTGRSSVRSYRLRRNYFDANNRMRFHAGVIFDVIIWNEKTTHPVWAYTMK